MFEELYAPLPDAGRYLERLGLEGVTRDLRGLDTLVRAHLTHIPFDDMDVWATGACPSLAVADLFEKIVVRGRGGYCFELNSLFCALLKALGFRAYTVAVRILEDRDFVPPPSHCSVICVLEEGEYFCDVGYGGPLPWGPVAMDGEAHLGYRLLRSGLQCTLERLDAPAGTVLEFDDVPARPVDLVPLNYYISQKPDSPFRSTLLVNRRLEGGGAYSVNGRQFKHHSPGGSTVREIGSPAELRNILEEYFGMDAGAVTLRDEL